MCIRDRPRQCVKQDDQSPRGPFIHSDKSYFINELSTFSELATVPSIPLRTHSIHYRPADELRRRKETVYATTQRSASSTPCGHAGNIAMAAVTAECTCESPLPATSTGKLGLLSAASVAPADPVQNLPVSLFVADEQRCLPLQRLHPVLLVHDLKPCSLSVAVVSDHPCRGGSRSRGMFDAVEDRVECLISSRTCRHWGTSAWPARHLSSTSQIPLARPYKGIVRDGEAGQTRVPIESGC